MLVLQSYCEYNLYSTLSILLQLWTCGRPVSSCCLCSLGAIPFSEATTTWRAWVRSSACWGQKACSWPPPALVSMRHWWELPQVSFLSRQKFCHNKPVFVTTKHVFCRDKSVLVATKLCLSWQNLCRDKHTFVMTKDVFCPDKLFYVGFFFSMTKVVTSILLSWQKTCFIATKMVLEAAPANNTQHPFPYQMRPKLVLTFDRHAHLACRSEAGDHLSVERKHSGSSNVGHDPQARPISVQVDQTLATCHLFICHSSCTGIFYMPSVTEYELEPLFLDIISHRIWTGTICALFSAECALELCVHRLSQNICWNFLHTIYHKMYTGIFCIPFITKYALELSRYHLSQNMH